MIRNVYARSKRDKKKAMRSRAWLNDVEVTNRCFYADDRAGIVRLYRVSAAGSKYVVLNRHNCEAAREELRGRVRIGRQARTI